MPGIRENVSRTITQNAKNNATSAPAKEKSFSSQASPPPSMPKSAEDYSPRSPIARAYKAGLMPPDHRLLLDAIRGELGPGTNEGTIQLETVLQKTGYLRASALKMLRHMQNFGILETRPGYRSTWVKVIKD